jgi:selenide, water dikinase
VKLLGALPRAHDPRALVGYESSDDAAVFRLGGADDPDPDTLLSTTDFFTPVVDSPFDFGRVAAANALSDIFAMGGEALFALNLVGFPMKALPIDVLGEILRGGAEVARDAGVPVLGGHSTDFDVPFYGMAVTGRVRLSRLRRNVGARPGDAVVLTKALGTGILTSALRARVLKEGSLFSGLKKDSGPSEDEERTAIASMTRLNRPAARAADAFAVSACTDVTGYGLFGHLREMLGGGGVSAEISVGAVPLLAGARRLAAAGIAPDGTRRNLAAARAVLEIAPGVSETDLLLLSDAQTSGGLLFALPAAGAEALVASLHAGGDTAAAVVGRMLPADAVRAGMLRVVP